jgi:hypothetical protein
MEIVAVTRRARPNSVKAAGARGLATIINFDTTTVLGIFVAPSCIGPAGQGHI